ncbi:hypothetical protein [Kitasatospora viridis]|uniref:Uncharacterized protein n=1 Tax=Kitasatospora viridis TaxID=281105 RepID=A0A561TTB6_9ACTN|nr:hypothetical protein [Kitasatospora viridis]TWF90334.1 hypothetical protein FHX73_13378 [Kitasatospora viridis]
MRNGHRVLPVVLLVAALSSCGGSGSTASPSPSPSPASAPPVLNALLAGRCPEPAPASIGSPHPGKAPLVPPGLSGELVICRYPGINAPAGATASPPTATVVRDAAAIRTLAQQLDALPLPLTGTVNCPADDGSSALLGFTGTAPGGVVLLAELSGCATVTDGHVLRELTGPALAQLRRPDMERMSGRPST